MSWRDDPATAKQVRFLVEHDVCEEAEAKALTKGQAHDMIQAVIDDDRDALDAAMDEAFEGGAWFNDP